MGEMLRVLWREEAAVQTSPYAVCIYPFFIRWELCLATFKTHHRIANGLVVRSTNRTSCLILLSNVADKQQVQQISQ
jgi:hypothetical protein